MKCSFAVHSYNEADALRRLVLSSLPLREWISDWVILDHRSDDHTQAVVTEMRGVLGEHRIPLTSLRESRDLSRDFTFADVRNKTIGACASKVVALHDADFILGPAYGRYLERALPQLYRTGTPYFGAAFTIPVIWDRLDIDDDGVVTDHGRVWIHNVRPRIFRKDSLVYKQTGDGGRWEKIHLKNSRMQRRFPLSGRRPNLVADSVLSVNVKPSERIALRDTMTMYMQDAMQGKASGTWLEDYQASKTRSQGDYEFVDVDLRGWRLFAGREVQSAN